MCGDTRSLIHGIINLIVPFFIYDPVSYTHLTLPTIA